MDCPMSIARLGPPMTQLSPSGDLYELNAFPLRTSLNHWGRGRYPLPGQLQAIELLVVFGTSRYQKNEVGVYPLPYVRAAFADAASSVSRIMTPAFWLLTTRATMVPSPESVW